MISSDQSGHQILPPPETTRTSFGAFPKGADASSPRRCGVTLVVNVAANVRSCVGLQQKHISH